MNCPRCGGYNPEDGNFCTSCGFDLRSGRQSAQPPQQEDTIRYRPVEEIPYYEDPRKKKKREKAQKKTAAGEGKKRRIWPFFLIPVAVLGVAFAVLAGMALLNGSPSGQETIAGGVTDFIRLDSSRILYLSNGDLYLYDGKESTLLAQQVEYVWSNTVMSASRVLYSY